MLSWKRILLLLIIASCHLQGWAQLSPGDLSQAHAELEGLFNCTKCHDLGAGISEAKCLECHVELKDRIDRRVGYHSSSEIQESSCIKCHSDHHGRNFDIIRFDRGAFDHDLTGYELVDAHDRQDCAACHKSEFIGNPKIKDKDYTFLGLDTRCLSCHSDSHQGTLSTECADCHDFKAFKPASYFDHLETDFPLLGKHLEVDCKSCHPIGVFKSQEFQQFADVEFSNCTSCHKDVHDNKFGQDCTECHSEESWHSFQGMSNFDHNQTKFPLAGQHRRTDCFACHENGTNNGKPFQEFIALQSFACVSCHEDVHESKLGDACATCHDERSFTNLIPQNVFEHDKTDYALEGRHRDVDCKECHEGSKIEPIDFSTCTQCHEDYHEGEFMKGSSTPDCAKCHTVHDFSEANFTIEQHAETAFALEGAHLATPCLDCHRKAEEWHFRNIGERCIDCHEDVHEGILDKKFYPNESCDKCHSVNQWVEVNFDHSQTDFLLEGKHLDQNCNACHLVNGIEGEHQLFMGLSQQCKDCHDDKHHGQFEVEGLTDCARCHAFEGWEVTRFDHDETAFKLEGEHLAAPCAACHKETQQGELKYTLYQIEKFECIDCHF